MSAAVLGTLATLAIGAAGRAAVAQQHDHGQHAAAPVAEGAAAPVGAPVPAAAAVRPGPPWPDVTLVDQDGQPVHFYTDLVRGRRVVMNFVFTTCTTICPPMGAVFERLQTLLAARAGGAGVRLLSLSVDPLTDTPERLKAWGAKFHAGPGWTLLTGRKEDVNRLLKALGVFTADPGDHAPIILLGDDVAGNWTRAYGLAPPQKIVEILDGLGAPAPAAPGG